MSSVAQAQDGWIELNSVSRIYPATGNRDETVALENVSLSIRQGEIYCLVGPSGCGKTTTLSLIAGFEFPSQGQVRVAGRDVASIGPDRVVVFQAPTLFPWLTVARNITFGPSVNGQKLSAMHEDMEALIRATGLDGFQKHYPYELSGGMQQRVALARALINKPAVLLMDEPFAALDAQNRVVMQELVMDVWAEMKTTILFITHDIDEAIFIADRVGVMSARPGRIVRELKVDLPRPRTYSMTTRSEFTELKKQVLELIQLEGVR